ncbi:MAG: competence/damage-inducible protein A [Azospirillum brasilense]|nr:MAG: competence/damage-inducible protein A [Azospirillum brasilense]
MNTTITAALIIIGNEILSGRTHDKNIPHIATKLNEAGVQLREVRVIPDIADTIVATVNEMRTAHDYVFTTGGIGPTHDDITSENVARAFGVSLHRHPEAERILRAHYTADQINEARLKMADVPVGATLIANPVSAAPGFIMGNVHVMAGVPRIMQAMLDHVLPTLVGGAPVLSVSVTTDLPEGTIADGLTALAQRYAQTDIGSYPTFKQGELSTTLVIRSPDAALNEAVAAELRALIASLGGQVMPTPSV